MNEIKAKIKEKEKNKQYQLNVRSRTIVVRDRIEQQKERNEKLQANYDQMKRERDNLEGEMKRILLDAERKKSIHDERCGPLAKSVDHTAVQLQSFQQSMLADQSRFVIKGASSQNTIQEKKKQVEGVVTTQRCFDEAISRIKSDVKSVSLNQMPVGIPCPIID